VISLLPERARSEGARSTAAVEINPAACLVNEICREGGAVAGKLMRAVGAPSTIRLSVEMPRGKK
jgi:hypothetical protein